MPKPTRETDLIDLFCLEFAEIYELLGNAANLDDARSRIKQLIGDLAQHGNHSKTIFEAIEAGELEGGQISARLGKTSTGPSA